MGLKPTIFWHKDASFNHCSVMDSYTNMYLPKTTGNFAFMKVLAVWVRLVRMGHSWTNVEIIGEAEKEGRRKRRLGQSCSPADYKTRYRKLSDIAKRLVWDKMFGLFSLPFSQKSKTKSLSFWSAELHTRRCMRLLFNQFSLTSSSAVVLVINNW